MALWASSGCVFVCLCAGRVVSVVCVVTEPLQLKGILGIKGDSYVVMIEDGGKQKPAAPFFVSCLTFLFSGDG